MRELHLRNQDAYYDDYASRTIKNTSHNNDHREAMMQRQQMPPQVHQQMPPQQVHRQMPPQVQRQMPPQVQRQMPPQQHMPPQMQTQRQQIQQPQRPHHIGPDPIIRNGGQSMNGQDFRYFGNGN